MTNIIKHYEIERVSIRFTHEEFNKAVRYKAFNNGSKNFLTEERKREMATEQQKLIVALRKEMNIKGAYSTLAEYQNKKMTILPSLEDETEYIIVFFDVEVDERALPLKVDLEQNLFYLEERID